MEVASAGLAVTPDVLIIYDIPPFDRRRFEAFQRHLPAQGPLSFSADPQARRFNRDKLSFDQWQADAITFFSGAAGFASTLYPGLSEARATSVQLPFP